MTTEMLQVISENGAASASQAPDLSTKDLHKIYRAMVLARLLDQRALKLQRQGRIGFYVPCRGQEASHVGSAAATGDDDWIFPSYRDAGIPLLKGVSLVELLHQCYGSDADNTRGRQMPVHYSFRRINFASISSPIGTQIVQATGVAMAAKVRQDPIAVLTYFGDGATSSNDFHAGLNFAGVFSSPCVFICENNGWAISVPVGGQTASDSMATKAEAYGMPGIRVDGNDVLAVYAATKKAVDRARAGGGPTMIETVTFRMGAHSSSDDDSRYRSAQLMEEWARRDPIKRFHQYLVNIGEWDADQEAALQKELEAEMQDAVQQAEQAAPLPISTMFEDVYEDLTQCQKEQLEQLQQDYEQGKLTGAKLGEFPL